MMKINKLIGLSALLLAFASSCVKETLPVDDAAGKEQIGTPAETPSDEESEKAILKALLAGRDTEWEVEDLDIPTLNGEWYEVRTANELAYLLEFGSTKGEKYRLVSDIDVAASEIAEKFAGEILSEPFEDFEFDGNGMTISGLNLPLAAGLFSRVKDSSIYDFTLDSSTIGSADNVSNLLGTGAVVGLASGTVDVSDVTVSSCNVYAPCKLGGFVGAVMDGSATFTSCAVSATNVNGIFLKGISGWCGGFVGFVGRTRENDTASSVNVTFTDCGVNGGEVKPYVESDLRTCGQFIGMLIGFDSNETVTMSGCDVQTTYEVQTIDEGQDDKSKESPHYIIGGHKYGNGIILVDGRDYNELSVISFNIRVMGGLSELINKNSWSRRKSATPAMIKDQCPDIFGVQEALSDQLTYVGDNLTNYSYVGVGREDGKEISEITDSEESGEIMAIFYNTSEIKLLEWGTYWLSETPEEPSISWEADYKRTMTWARMETKYSGRKFFYVNTHLDNHSGTAREEGLKLIVNKIAEMNTDNLPVVLTGDFNVTPDNSVLGVLVDAEMLDARTTATTTDELATFNGFGDEEERVIDYIYYRGFSSCPEYETIVKQYANVQYISDHYPIVARLMF